MARPSLPGLSRAGAFRRLAGLVGAVIVALSVLLLLRYAVRHWADLPALSLSGDSLGWISAAGALYFGSLLTTSAAWLQALRTLGGRLNPGAAVGVALVSQIGKYAPGGVAQHVGRAALASARGLPVATTVQASLMEASAAVVASGMVAGALLALAPGDLQFAWAEGLERFGARFWPLAVGLVLLACLAFALSWRRPADSAARLPSLARGLGLMLVSYGLSFALAGASFHALAQAFGDGPGLGACIAVYAIAWTAGFLTPGAPAGLGVRESILVGLLAASMGPAAMSVAVAHRLLTAVTDGAAAGVGALVLARSDD